MVSANPGAVTARSTVDGGRLATMKLPSTAVGTTRLSPVSALVTVTVAAATGAACASRTRPRSVAVACPLASSSRQQRDHRARHHCTHVSHSLRLGSGQVPPAHS